MQDKVMISENNHFLQCICGESLPAEAVRSEGEGQCPGKAGVTWTWGFLLKLPNCSATPPVFLQF